ncbi:MAG: ketoacyl-ACP synthase III [Ruminococcus sp.]|nr:ketoacyl-ACP synthase III [Ruminococcus sp.]
MTGVKILGVGKCAPETVATNEDFSKIVETNDEWITTRTGIKKRHISNGEPTWYLGAEAAKNAVEDAGISPDDIGLIIVTTITNDYSTPSVSCIVQRELGAKNAMTIDVNCACSGFVYGFDMAKRYLQTDENLKYALVISAEELSKITDYTDRATCVLFGDGAAAVVLEKKENTVYSSFLGADGNGAKFLLAKSYDSHTPFSNGEVVIEDDMPKRDNNCLFQDGREVYKFATKILPFACEKTCETLGIAPNDIDCIIPHQANKRIIETAAKNLSLPLEKFFLNLEEYGNTSSASVPLALCDAVHSGAVKRGDKICIVGFGAGLTFGSVIFEY